MSKFLNEVYKRGNIKKYNNLKELEDDCPSFYIGEKIDTKYSYNTGDIVFVKYYNYANGRTGNNHLFVIVDEDNYGVSLNYFCILISSKLNKLKYKTNVLLKKDNINNLKTDSIVKADIIYEFNDTDIEFLVGKVSVDMVNDFKKVYLQGDKNENR